MKQLARLYLWNEADRRRTKVLEINIETPNGKWPNTLVFDGLFFYPLIPGHYMVELNRVPIYNNIPLPYGRNISR